MAAKDMARLFRMRGVQIGTVRIMMALCSLVHIAPNAKVVMDPLPSPMPSRLQQLGVLRSLPKIWTLF